MTAYFYPPYGRPDGCSEELLRFAEINHSILGKDPKQAEIFSWSTNWSNYFDAGHEWWGAYYWTVRAGNQNRLVVIGASSTD